MIRGSNSGVGENFRTRPDGTWGPPSLLYNGYWVFLRCKTAGASRWPPTPSSAEVKERVELYLYSTSGPSWPVTEWTLPLSLPFVSPLYFFNFSNLSPGEAIQIAPFKVTLFALPTVSPRNLTPLYLWNVTSVESHLTFLNEMRC